MSKMIKGLTSKLAKLEMEGENVVRPVQEGGNRPPNQYRRPFQPQKILQRERRNNDDQRIQPPLQNNFADDMEQIDELEDNEIHLVEKHIHPTHLTISDYEDALEIDQVFEDVYDSFVNIDLIKFIRLKHRRNII